MELYYYDCKEKECYKLKENLIEENDILWYENEEIKLYAPSDCSEIEILKLLTREEFSFKVGETIEIMNNCRSAFQEYFE